MKYGKRVVFATVKFPVETLIITEGFGVRALNSVIKRSKKKKKNEKQPKSAFRIKTEYRNLSKRSVIGARKKLYTKST